MSHIGERIYTNDGVYIAKAMKDHLNTWDRKPVIIHLEAFDKNPTSMMMQQLSGAFKKRSYINGSYVGSWPFAVYIRISGKDTANRLDATGTLDGLNEWLTTTELPSLGDNRMAVKIEMASLPSIAARHDNGSEDYQAIYELEYYYQGGTRNA